MDWLAPATMTESWLNFLLIVVGMLALINWYAAWKENLSLYYFTKPLVLTGLILYVILSGKLTPERFPFLLGLAFSLLGDIFFIPRGTSWFIAGMAAFSITQILYIWGFSYTLPSTHVLVVALVAYLAGLLIIHLALNRFSRRSPLSKSFLPFFKIYAALVLGMAVNALLCLARPGWSDSAAVMAGIGGILFFTSDAMIGLDKLDKRLPKFKFWIIVTYHVAQFLITAAILTISA